MIIKGSKSRFLWQARSDERFPTNTETRWRWREKGIV